MAKIKVTRGATQFVHLINAMKKGGTAARIADVSGWHETTVRNYLNVFHKSKLVYIDHYRVNGRHRAAVWSWRTSPYQQDAERPATQTATQRHKKYFDKKVQEAAREMMKDMRATV